MTTSTSAAHMWLPRIPDIGNGSAIDSVVADYAQDLLASLARLPALFREQEDALSAFFGALPTCDAATGGNGRHDAAVDSAGDAKHGAAATVAEPRTDLNAADNTRKATDLAAGDADAVTGDDGAGSVSINAVSVTEGAAGTSTTATFTITRTGGTRAFSVSYATAAGTATQGADVQTVSGTVSFGDGENSQTVSVAVNGDATNEASETFFVNLTGATGGATVASSQGQGTIADDDIGEDVGFRHNGFMTIASSANNSLGAVSERDWFRATLQSGIAMSLNERGHPSGGGLLPGTATRLDLTGGADAAIDGSFGIESLLIGSSSASHSTTAATGSNGSDTADMLSLVAVQHSSSAGDMLALEQLVTTWFGQDSDDRIVGSAGADRIDGGLGNDTLIGGSGADTYFVDSSFDVIVEAAGRETDTVYATSTYKLADNVENIYLQGTADLAAYGNASANLMFGNSGNNAFDGGAEADVMYGYDGHDAFILRLGDGNGDVVMDFAGNGDAVGDSLLFFGLGTAETSVTQINATLWQATGSQGSLQFTLANGAALYASDYSFHV